MALPLKSGADLYNQQAIRMRLHNLGADPTEVGKGLIYFNTNTDTAGSNHALHACVHDGASFKALAYVDDVANNEEFLAVKRKVDAFFDGGVDADNVLENLAEVQKFLDNYSGATSLSQILDTKLDKSGGTLTAANSVPLTLKGSTDAWLKFEDNSGELGYFGFLTNKTPVVYMGGSNKTLLHSSNYSDYALPLSGGTIVSAEYIPLTIKRTTAYGVGLSFANSNGPLGTFVVDHNHIAGFDDGTTNNTLLHSGNVGKYALKRNLANYYVNLDSPLDADAYAEFHNYFQRISADGSSISTNDIGSARKGVIRLTGGGSESQLLFDHYNGMMYYRIYATSSWSPWKTIAFTDSDITGYSAGLKHSNGAVGATVESSGRLQITGYGLKETNDLWRISTAGLAGITTTGLTDMLLLKGGNGVMLSNGTSGLILNSSGNVTIGNSDLAGTGAKLFVNGTVKTAGDFMVFSDSSFSTRFTITYADNIARIYNTGATSELYIGDYQGRALNIITNNVLIGKTTDNGKGKLQVEGDLYVSGNIIAEKQVSAKGKAKEAPASGGGGGGLFYATTIAEGTTSTSIAHNLGTENVIISIYEKSTMSGEVTWNQILTDVEIKGINSVQVTFGSETDVEHKVVIMGASAA